MKVTKDKVENSQAYLTVEMEQSELEGALEQAYRKLVKKYNIPGFRKGKTPRPILEQYLGGKTGLLEEAINLWVPEACEKAIEEQELKPLARPEVEVTKTEPVTFTAVVPLIPVIKLGDYNQIRIAPDSIELKEEDVNATIEQLRHQHALWEPIEHPAELNDLLVLDIESTIGAQPYINQKDAQYQILKDMVFPMPGFSEQMLGLKAGDTKEFKLTFPADYARTELAGKDAAFKVKVSEVKLEKLPEVNDDFAKQVSAEFKTVDLLKERVRNNLKLTAEEQTRAAHEQKVMDAVVEQSTLEFPAILVDEEIDMMIKEQMQRWQMNEKGLDEYLKSTKKTAEELRNDMRPFATKRVKQSLVLTQLAKEEKIQITEPDIQQEMERIVRGATEKKNELLKSLATPQGIQSMAQIIATRKTVARMVDISKGIAKPVEETKEVKPAEATNQAEAKTEIKAEMEIPQKEAGK